MKKLVIILFILSSFNSKGTIHTIGVWGGYYEFVPWSITIQLGDTIEWEPYFGLLPMMLHTITSNNIPLGAVSFDQVWQMPADTFFQYIPQVAGLYQYVCTPHIPNGMIGEFTVNNVSNTQTYVPDDNFEAYLEANGMGNGVPNDDYVTTANINAVTYLNISNIGASNLIGIEDFTALTSLMCSGNQLTSLDVSTNLALEYLLCNNNSLTSLDVSQNTALTSLRFNNNQLTSLDVSTNLALTYLDCPYNQLTSLDVSNNTALNYLYCPNNQLTSLDVSNNTALYTLFCNNNQLTSLDVRNGNNINWLFDDGFFFGCTNNPSLTCIEVDDDAWSTTNLTVAIGNIDAQHYFSTNCSTTAIQEHTTNKELLKVTDLLGRETKQTNQPLFYIYDDGTVEKRIVIE